LGLRIGREDCDAFRGNGEGKVYSSSKSTQCQIGGFGGAGPDRIDRSAAPAPELLGAAVGGDVMLGGFGGVVLGLDVMAVSQMGVVGGLLMIALFMMLGGGVVVPRGIFVMLGRVAMMIGVFLRHGKSFHSSLGSWCAFQRY
jgi:hypothetical protein